MARAPWKYDALTGRVTVVIPPSVERVGSFDDPAILREYDGTPSWLDKGHKMELTPVALVDMVSTVAHLAGDQVYEDLSVGGAVRWAKRMTDELRKAGWAQYSSDSYGYKATDAARAAGLAATVANY